MSNKTYTGTEGIREQTDNLVYIANKIQRQIRQQAITVSTTAVALPTAALSRRKILKITNNSGNILYLGNSSVTTSDGDPLYPRQAIILNVEDSIDIYGISTASSDIRILEGA